MKHGGIIRRVQITEKSTRLACDNRYMLEVARTANKIEIKKAVEELFGVHVLGVRTQNYKGVLRTLRNRRVVRGPSWKRAIVTVKAGERIELI